MIRLLLSLFLALPPLISHAQDRAGQFDYYVLSLSWSPGWCSASGDRRDAEQCDIGRNVDFIVHGLWPQHERGWPENCRTSERNPSRRETAAMADVMGSGGLAWYQWKKHGRCTGLSSGQYFSTLRDAADRIAIPAVFDDLSRDISLPPSVVEDAFIEANPDLSRNAVTVTCQGKALQEVRICLTRDLEPRDCAPDIRRDCSRPDVLMEKVR
jgi:ribonuclease T2